MKGKNKINYAGLFVAILILISLLFLLGMIFASIGHVLVIEKDYFEYETKCYDKFGSEIEELTCKKITACSVKSLKFLDNFRCEDLDKYNMTFIKNAKGLGEFNEN